MMNFEDVPQRIRELFGSVRTTGKIEEISRRADLATPNLLPRLLYLLEIKEISAHDFIPKMREMMGFGETRAKSVARAIKEDILELERAELYKWGVDISFIDVGDAPDLPEAPAVPDEELEEEEQEAKVKTIGGLPIVGQTPQMPPVKVAVKKELEEAGGSDGEVKISAGGEGAAVVPRELKPFILHEERPQAMPVAGQMRGFSLPIGFFDAKAKPKEEARRVPVKAEVWGAGKNIVQKIIKGEAKKTIHYTSARTPVSPFGERDDKKIFAPKSTGRPVFSWPDRTGGEGDKREVKLEGNKVILSKNHE